ncbi:MAG: prepilin-type N-terminal cleavage/methylation domain-containing protein [Cyanobium sp. MAG06]|nr:prepilin-type N-terminal cleavage/methylation domain-containing protein [Cyanobium sp. MAG06]
MINYIRNKYSRGYTLIEVMISVAIFGIIGAVLFGDTPSIGKAVAFNTEANLITDIVRDIQIKGSSGYVGTNDNVASSTKYTGLGLTFSTAENKITVFADNKDAINERGVYEGNKYFNNGDKKITTSALSGVSVKDSV